MEKAVLSGIGDILDIGGSLGLLKRGINFTRNRFLNQGVQPYTFPSIPTNTQNSTNSELRKRYLDKLRKYAEVVKDKTPNTFTKKHPKTGDDLSKIKLKNEELDIIEDLPVPSEKTKYFESIPYNIAKREGYKVSNIVSTNPRVAIYNSTKGNQLAHGYFFPKRSNERDLTNYVFLNNTGFNRSTMTHELNHKYVYDGQILPTELTSKQEKLITEAYPTRIETIPGSNTTIERRAVNEQLREEFVNEFYKRNGRYPEINSDRNELFEFLEKCQRRNLRR